MEDTAPRLLQPPFPTASSYTPRTEHESATPSTFFGDKQVLYAELGVCDIYVLPSDSENESTWSEFLGIGASNGVSGHGEDAVNGHGAGVAEPQWWAKKGAVHGFVGSGSLTLLITSSPTADTSNPQPTSALSIPYPSISLHATRDLQGAGLPDDSSTPGQTRAIYLQVAMDSGAEREDQDDGTVEVLLVPTVPVGGQSSNGDGMPNNGEKVKEVYEALCACSELHPDPDEDEDEQGGGGGGLAALLGGGGAGGFGAGGWITAENAHEFEGEFGDVNVEVGEGDGEGGVGEGEAALGPGAGSVRTYDGDEEDSAKWQRTG